MLSVPVSKSYDLAPNDFNTSTPCPCSTRTLCLSNVITGIVFTETGISCVIVFPNPSFTSIFTYSTSLASNEYSTLAVTPFPRPLTTNFSIG